MNSFCNRFIISNLQGAHSITSVLFQGLAIGPDNHDISERLTKPTFKLAQELHRNGMLFYNKDQDEYFKIKLSITVDKKELNQLTVTGGGTYLTKFFDVYTDDNQETKGFMSWRQCEACYQKGNKLQLSF